MIYTADLEMDYCGSRTVMASDSLQVCIDACNNYINYPDLANRVIFTCWSDHGIIAVSMVSGKRESPITYEEVMSNFVKNPNGNSFKGS